MTNQRQCERCGRPLNGATSDSICPACVAQLGQATWLGESATEAFDASEDHRQRRAEALHTPDPGTTRIPYFGDYELLEEIARGGMGVVYRARQVSLNRPVALKLISAGSLATPELVKRFRAEAETAASLTHPNIVPIFEIGQHEGQHYFSMGLVEGPNLRKRLNGHPLATRDAAALMAWVARAVHYAHQRGVLHRDLKPSNIVVDREGRPHLTDFGLAKLIEQESTLTHTNAVLGTPSYMAPEQARGAAKEVTTAADVYGLGAVLYETLTGHPPFAGGTSVETIRLVLEQEPRRPSLWNSAVDRDLETICLKCLEKEPERRYASADALAEDLERWLSGQPILARPAAPWERALKWAGRKPAIASLMAAVVLVSAVGLTGVLWQWKQAMESRNQALEARERAEENARQASEREEQIRRYLYAANMNLVQQAWEQNDVRRVRRLLEATAGYPNRGFEWYYWQRQAHQELKTLRGHSSLVNGVAFSPNGQRIVTGSPDGTARVWDASTGQELLTFSGGYFGGGRFPVAFSPDGQRIASGGRDLTTIKVWDASGPAGWRAHRASPGNATTVKVWDASSGEELLTFKGHSGEIWSLAFSPDGKRIVSGSWDQTAKIWEASTGQELLTFKGHSSGILSVAFSPDGQRIVTGSADLAAKVWDAFTGEELLTFKGHSNGILSVAFSPDGQRVVSGGWDQTAKVWDASVGQELLTFKGHSSTIEAVAFFPDGQRIVTAGLDGTAKVWDASSGEELFTFKGHNSSTIYSLAVSADGQRIVTGGGDQTVKLWDASSREELLKGHSSRIESVAFSPGGQRIVTGSWDRTAKVWDASSREELLTFKGHSGGISSVVFFPDGQRIITGSEDGTARVWDASTGEELLTFKGHSGGISSVVFSPDGQRVVTGSEDGTARVWDASTGEVLLTLEGHFDEISSATVSPDGQRIITGSEDGIARVWDASTGEDLVTLEGNNGAINSVTFSPDGHRIVTGSSWNFTTRDFITQVWDASTGEELVALEGHNNEINSVTFSPDGQRIVTGSSDGTTRVWDVSTGQGLLTLKSHRGPIYSAHVSPDGQRIITGGEDGTARVWQAASPEQVAAWLAEEEAAAAEWSRMLMKSQIGPEHND